ncbi:ATP-binding protein [Streptomyces cupreus]|uniref:Uncharacterized protein n=1 Tax=Streptomyces cupreus TaxID=2759956 RepID=A0A7X1M6P7_9ACTN|nr:hypothetical protein [Streptomyces cupreus]MBC2900097.1 hypothetical protein [Streptomyces cupreus]
MNVWTCVGCAAKPGGCYGDPAEGLVGRARESAVLERLLAGHRLVTVTGRAGVGKSRMAAAVGTRGPWRVVHVHGQGKEAPAAAVRRALTRGGGPQTGDTLLFLDDVDPVHREAVGVVQRLLGAVPGLRVLVTSRQVLGLGEEQVLRLAPLPCQPAAVELFLQRAQDTVQGFRAEGADLHAVEAICRTLEGVPLAIELAAEQVALQPVQDLAEMLDVNQCWLRGERPALRRHRSLRATVGAGYALCEREARIVWGRASVLAGAFNESTAAFLCGGGGVEPHRVPSLLARLAAIHVLEPVRDPGGPRPPRYRMTRAARDFGTERLHEAGECETALERLAAHCRQVAETAANLWATGLQSQAVTLVQEEEEELTAVLRQAVNRPDHAGAALETVVSLWFWWLVYGRAEEGRDHLLRLLPLSPDDSPVGVRGRWLAAWLGADRDPQAARALLGRAWPQAVLTGDDAAVGHIAHVQGLIALREGDPRGATEYFEEAAHTIPDRPAHGPSPAVSLAAQAVTEAAFAPGAARRTVRRALAQQGVRDDDWATLLARHALAYVDHRHGRSDRALHRARRALATLDNSPAAPQGYEALCALVADIEACAPGRPYLPHPRAGASGLVRTDVAHGVASAAGTDDSGIGVNMGGSSSGVSAVGPYTQSVKE